MADAAATAGAAAERALNRRYFLDFPGEAAALVESGEAAKALPAIQDQPPDVLVRLWGRLTPSTGAELFAGLPGDRAARLLAEMPPNQAVKLLAQLDPPAQESALASVSPSVGRELRGLMSYPEDSAGRLMDARIRPLRDSVTVGEAIDALRRSGAKTTRSLYLIDADNRLSGKVAFQRLAIGAADATLAEIAEPIVFTVNTLAPREEIAEAMERHRLADLPVVDMDGELVGIIYHADLISALQADTSADIQAMVGASRDERALSPALFAVRKRQPWLQINLLTAFLAASVVGLFESTIAQFTALAVLLPVVAGQSGNAGAQALAVTMRGLALREITVRHWLKVMRKEVTAGFMNGVMVAVTCGIGVLVWSGSFGLLLVIATSMVLAMVAAGFAGALVPIVLTRFGQDPAQASSIILTTVTDIAGFFSFLGIATALASLL